MAVTVNGSVLTATNATGASPADLVYTSAVLTANDVLVSIACMNGPVSFPSASAPTGGSGLTWTQIIDQQNTASHFSRVTAYWALVGSGQTSTITQGTTAGADDSGSAGALLRLSGAHQTTPIGQTDGFQGQTDPTGTDLQLSGTAGGSLIIMAGSDWSAGTASLTISISSTTGGITDLNNLETSQFRAVVHHGAQSGSTDQGTLDYSAATGDWAAVIFEIVAAVSATSGPRMFPGMVSRPVVLTWVAGRTGAAHSR